MIGIEEFIELGVLFGLLLSIPSMLILWFVLYLVDRKLFTPPINQKLFVAIICALLSLLSFGMLLGFGYFLADIGNIRFTLSYTITVIASSLFFNLKKSIPEE